MHRHLRSLALAGVWGLLCVPPRPAAAQVPPSPALGQARRISLNEALSRLGAENLDLRIARQEVGASQGRLTTAGTFFNPGLSVTREQLSGGPGGYHETTVTLGQTFEVGGQRGLRRDAATFAVSAAEAQLASELTRLQFEVRRAYVRAAAAEALAATIEETAAVFREVERAGRVQLEQGDISAYASQRLGVERARYEALVADAHLELVRAGRELALLVAPDSTAANTDFLLLPDTPLEGGAAAIRPITLEAALASVADRPDVRAAALDVEVARSGLALRQREPIPNVTLQGGFKEQADGLRGLVLGLSIPIPLLDRGSGRIEEARAELAVAESRQALALRRAETDALGAWETFRSLEARSELLAAEFPGGAAGLLETSLVAYAEGEMSLVELLDAADAYRAAREASTELLARYITAFHDLERALARQNADDPTALDSGRQP